MSKPSVSQQKREARIKEKTNQLGKEIRLLEYQTRQLNDSVRVMTRVMNDLIETLKSTRVIQVPYPTRPIQIAPDGSRMPQGMSTTPHSNKTTGGGVQPRRGSTTGNPLTNKYIKPN